MDGHSAIPAVLTRGRPYFSLTGPRRPASARGRHGMLLFCELSTAEEEYLIRCNGIRVIRFQKDDICNLLQLL